MNRKIFKLSITIVLVSVSSLMITMGCNGTQIQEKAVTEVVPISVACKDCAKLEIFSNKKTYLPTEPITITARALVLDDVHLSAPYRSSPMQNFEISIINEQNRTVSLTEEGFTAREGQFGFRLEVGINKNQPFEEIFNITPWFELTTPGVYTLTVKKWMWLKLPEKIEVTSQPIVFEISSDNLQAGLILESEKKSYLQGEPITITAKVLVLDDVYLSAPYHSSPMQSFDIGIINEQNQTIPLTEKGFMAKERQFEFQPEVSISQKKSFEETFRLDEWFELTTPGIYTLTVRKWMWLNFPEKVTVVSEPMVFKILPKK